MRLILQIIPPTYFIYYSVSPGYNVSSFYKIQIADFQDICFLTFLRGPVDISNQFSGDQYCQFFMVGRTTFTCDHSPWCFSNPTKVVFVPKPKPSISSVVTREE